MLRRDDGWYESRPTWRTRVWLAVALVVLMLYLQVVSLDLETAADDGSIGMPFRADDSLWLMGSANETQPNASACAWTNATESTVPGYGGLPFPMCASMLNATRGCLRLLELWDWNATDAYFVGVNGGCGMLMAGSGVPTIACEDDWEQRMRGLYAADLLVRQRVVVYTGRLGQEDRPTRANKTSVARLDRLLWPPDAGIAPPRIGLLAIGTRNHAMQILAGADALFGARAVDVVDLLQPRDIATELLICSFLRDRGFQLRVSGGRLTAHYDRSP